MQPRTWERIRAPHRALERLDRVDETQRRLRVRNEMKDLVSRLVLDKSKSGARSYDTVLVPLPEPPHVTGRPQPLSEKYFQRYIPPLRSHGWHVRFCARWRHTRYILAPHLAQHFYFSHPTYADKFLEDAAQIARGGNHPALFTVNYPQGIITTATSTPLTPLTSSLTPRDVHFAFLIQKLFPPYLRKNQGFPVAPSHADLQDTPASAAELHLRHKKLGPCTVPALAPRAPAPLPLRIPGPPPAPHHVHAPLTPLQYDTFVRPLLSRGFAVLPSSGALRGHWVFPSLSAAVHFARTLITGGFPPHHEVQHTLRAVLAIDDCVVTLTFDPQVRMRQRSLTLFQIRAAIDAERLFLRTSEKTAAADAPIARSGAESLEEQEGEKKSNRPKRENPVEVDIPLERRRSFKINVKNKKHV